MNDCHTVIYSEFKQVNILLCKWLTEWKNDIKSSETMDKIKEAKRLLDDIQEDLKT